MLERCLRTLCLLSCAWLLFSGCSDSHDPKFGGETNWLRTCEHSSACGPGDCVCGVCSAACTKDSDCPDGLRCQGESSELYAQTCGVDVAVHGVCSPACKHDSDCGADQSCSGGTCAPLALSSEGDGGAVPDSTRQLVVDAHLELTQTCEPDLEHPIGSGVGVFDIAPNGNGVGDFCAKPYMLTLRVQNLASESVLVTKAEVLLLSLDQRVLVLAPDMPLPNPFALSVTGSVPAAGDSKSGLGVIVAEAIPVSYAPFLSTFKGREVAVRVKLSGETLDGTRVHSNAFEYRVSICDGCLTACQGQLDAEKIIRDDFIGNACDDNAAADGRMCVDPDC